MYKDLDAALQNLATFYSNPIAQTAVAKTTPLIYVMQKGLETGDLSLCYDVLEKIRKAYKSAEPYASGFLLTLTKRFVQESGDMLQKKAGADALKTFVVNAVAGMKHAASEFQHTT